MMSDPMSKALLLQQIQATRQQLETVLAQVEQSRMTEPGVEGEWSVKDLLAHIVVWEQRMLRWLGETLQGQEPQMLPPGLTWDDLDQWNEQTYLENRDKPLAEVLAEFAQSYPQVLAAVEAAPEAELLEPDRFAWREGRPLWHLVAANMNWHYADHAETIAAWLMGKRSDE